MPKNAHPPRGKPAKKAPPPEEDTSFIVFGDGKPKKKKGESSGAPGDDKGKGKGPSGQAEDGPKKPDTRTLIAGASWTGKLPVNLFSEHLQKQQWGKPDYRIVRQPRYAQRAPQLIFVAQRWRHALRIRCGSVEEEPQDARSHDSASD